MSDHGFPWILKVSLRGQIRTTKYYAGNNSFAGELGKAKLYKSREEAEMVGSALTRKVLAVRGTQAIPFPVDSPGEQTSDGTTVAGPTRTITIDCVCCGLPQLVRERPGVTQNLCEICAAHQGAEIEIRLARAEQHETWLRERIDACRKSEELVRERFEEHTKGIQSTGCDGTQVGGCRRRSRFS
jgi:hypothetical protein